MPSIANLVFHVPSEIRNHLYQKGINQVIKHGEEAFSRQASNIEASFDGGKQGDKAVDTTEMANDAFNTCNGNPKSFESLLKDVENPFFPSFVRFTKLSTLIRLYNAKARNGWSDKIFLGFLPC